MEVDFQLIRIPAGMKDREPIELDRAWQCFTVVWMPQSVRIAQPETFDDEPTFRLHLTQSDEGIPVTPGMTIRVPGFTGQRVYWSSRYNYGFASQKILLLASDAVGVDMIESGLRPLLQTFGPTSTFDKLVVSRETDQPSDEWGPYAAAMMVKDGSSFRALTPADLVDSSSADPESVFAGNGNLATTATTTLIAAPGAGFALRIRSAVMSDNTSNALELREVGSGKVLASWLGAGSVEVFGGLGYELAENEALEIHNAGAGTAGWAASILYDTVSV